VHVEACFIAASVGFSILSVSMIQASMKNSIKTDGNAFWQMLESLDATFTRDLNDDKTFSRVKVS
jgi:hypothetical protein